jgi:predicted RNA binding protein YcfA (HicA-like mRNA interferase family)
MRLTPVSRIDFIKRLRSLGWAGPYVGGKHQFMVKGAHQVPIPNPHGSREISVAKLSEILKELGIEREDWIKTH